jgi:Plant transposon protein
VAAYQRVVNNYFNGRESVYSEYDFERRFRVPRSVFNRIHDRLMGTHPFIHYEDATKKKGIYLLVKLVGCFRYLAYGDAFDREDENLHLSASSLRSIVKDFAKIIVREFGPQYLNRFPMSEERRGIANAMAARGFPGCLGSWDCKHFNWKNCPMRLAGQHQGHSEGGKKTLIVEAIADHRRYIWGANFGDPGSLNDLNVLDKSSIIGALLSGEFRIDIDKYSINNNERDWMYFLADGIYPEWAIFVSSFNKDATSDQKKKRFATYQERVRKDVECAFGILVQRFHILQRPLRNWDQAELGVLVHCCIIIHNMVVEARFGKVTDDLEEMELDNVGATFPLFGYPQVSEEEAAADGCDLWAARVAQFGTHMESSYEHLLLKKDLVEHINTFDSDS